MQLTEMYDSLGNEMKIAPPLAPGLHDVAVTGLLSSEGRQLTAICTVAAGDGTARPILWSVDFDAELSSTASAALASLGSVRWLIGQDGQIERVSASW